MYNKDLIESLQLSVKIKEVKLENIWMGVQTFVMYIVIDNYSLNRRAIVCQKGSYVTQRREQVEADEWLSGYMKNEDVILPNSYKKGAIAFDHSKLKKVSNNDSFYLSIELPKEGIKINVVFTHNDGKWEMTGFEKEDIDIQLPAKQIEKLLLKKVERLEPFEERLGVSIEKVSIKVHSDLNNSYSFTLYGELHLRENSQLERTIKLNLIIYDKEGNIAHRADTYFKPSTFFIFQVFDLYVSSDYISPNSIGSIRLYPNWLN
ncbi:MAG TPA: hypothetical protein VFL76_03460 [Edaphocola sp.]|nr:hypothetical protein [Edaphocola sp.]